MPLFLQTGTCALFFSAQGGFLEVVKELLSLGAPVDLPSYVSITVMSQECHCICDHWPLDCLFNSLFMLTKKKTSMYYWSFVRKATGGWWIPLRFPSQRARNAESSPMSTCHHQGTVIMSVWLRRLLGRVPRILTLWLYSRGYGAQLESYLPQHDDDSPLFLWTIWQLLCARLQYHW